MERRRTTLIPAPPTDQLAGCSRRLQPIQPAPAPFYRPKNNKNATKIEVVESSKQDVDRRGWDCSDFVAAMDLFDRVRRPFCQTIFSTFAAFDAALAKRLSSSFNARAPSSLDTQPGSKS